MPKGVYTRKPHVLDLVCAICHAPFHTFPSAVKLGAKYCSATCRSAGKRRPLQERCWEKIDQSAGPDACWPWAGKRNRHGYGVVSVTHSTTALAHRLILGFVTGTTITRNVLHKCPGGGNPWCCNPAHLKEGSQAENAQDKVAYGRQMRGESHYNAKLTESDIIDIRRQAAEGASIAALARRYGMAHSAISRIISRNAWRHVQ